ncbi:MAG: PH domain-containing protein [Flavobacteriales bacterium]|jgi:hypothetical protein
MLYRSKIGYELAIPIFGVLGVVAALMLKMKGPIAPLLIPVSLIVIIAYLFYDTTYTIKGKELEIRFGFLYKQKIDITTIREIKETNNPLSSPAASLDRLDIRYGRSGSVLISPKDKQKFVQALLEVHPEIVVKWKKK